MLGIDISTTAIRAAEQLAEPGLSFEVKNVENTNLSVEEFDLITAFQTHFHWQDLKKAFSEIRRVLTDEGILLVACEYAKIRYYLPQYIDTQAYQKFLNTIGLQLVQEEKQQGWRFYKIKKKI